MGHNVLVTTTTKMYLPEKKQVDNIINLADKSENQLTQKPINLSEPAITFCYKDTLSTDNNNKKIKVSGVTTELIDNLKNDSYFTVFIIEADGAKCLPIKAPSGHEPCIPISSDMVIGVIGAEVIHTQVTAERIHRWETFSALTQCIEGELLGYRVLRNLIEHPHGMFKSAPENAIKVWLINKMDRAENSIKVIELAEQLLQDTTKPDAIWLAAMNNQTPIKRILMRS